MVDTLEDGVGWASYLRVRVELELYQSLPRGRTITFNNSNMWVPLKYEKLSKFCLRCGKMLHEKMDV